MHTYDRTSLAQGWVLRRLARYRGAAGLRGPAAGPHRGVPGVWDEDQCWTLARITGVLRRQFGVDYTLAGMDREERAARAARGYRRRDGGRVRACQTGRQQPCPEGWRPEGRGNAAAPEAYP
jgi:hypothetical protein